MIRTRCYRDGAILAEGFAVADVSDHLADPRNTVWFDLCAPEEKELGVIREELGLHTLAIEDVLQPGQRPKLDQYAEHLFIVAYSVDMDPQTQQLRHHEVSVFLTRNAIVTVRSDEGFDIDAVVQRWDDQPNLASSGVSFLLHGLLDYVVDSHFDAVQHMDEEIDDLEDRLFNDVDSDAQLQRRTFQARKSLVSFRRVVLPMREVVNSLLRRDLGVVDEKMMPYFQDVYDHVLRVTERTESLRDLMGNIMETRIALRSNRLNVIMKKVTSWAAIIAVPTAVTGFYGQNLPYPGYQQAWGFWMSAAVILLLSGGLYVAFRRSDWL
jgi:magnesium transporter